MGSVTSMLRGRMSVTVIRVRILADRLGKGKGGDGRPRRFARLVRMVCLCVSRDKVVRMNAKIARKKNQGPFSPASALADGDEGADDGSVVISRTLL